MNLIAQADLLTTQFTDIKLLKNKQIIYSDRFSVTT